MILLPAEPKLLTFILLGLVPQALARPGPPLPYPNAPSIANTTSTSPTVPAQPSPTASSSSTATPTTSLPSLPIYPSYAPQPSPSSPDDFPLEFPQTPVTITASGPLVVITLTGTPWIEHTERSEAGWGLVDTPRWTDTPNGPDPDSNQGGNNGGEHKPPPDATPVPPAAAITVTITTRVPIVVGVQTDVQQPGAGNPIAPPPDGPPPDNTNNNADSVPALPQLTAPPSPGADRLLSQLVPKVHAPHPSPGPGNPGPIIVDGQTLTPTPGMTATLLGENDAGTTLVAVETDGAGHTVLVVSYAGTAIRATVAAADVTITTTTATSKDARETGGVQKGGSKETGDGGGAGGAAVTTTSAGAGGRLVGSRLDTFLGILAGVMML